jgi:hypothetical protein
MGAVPPSRFYRKPGRWNMFENMRDAFVAVGLFAIGLFAWILFFVRMMQ